ncbi:MAG: biotin--[acetyl-CoA-carboxylase] ligase [Sphingomicrobium sp.]
MQWIAQRSDRSRRRILVLTRIRIVASAASTNDSLIGEAGAVEGDWLVALDQLRGKGRQGREWTSVPGNFAGSTLVQLRSGDPPAQSLSMVASLALAEAVDAAVPNQPLLLKWPNDLLLNGAKLAGILLERRGDKVVIGIGVNLAAAPVLEGRRAAHLGARVTPAAFAPILASAMARMIELWRSASPMLFANAWLARAHVVGTALKVHGGDGVIVEGRFHGIDNDGALQLRLPDGALHTVLAGDVSLD